MKVNKFISFLEVIIKGLNWGGLMIVLPSMTIMVFIDVVLRYIFNAPLMWGKEVSEYMLLLVFFLSVTQCWNTGGHVRMGLLIEHLGERWQTLSEILSAVIGVLFWGMLVYQAFQSSLFDLRMHAIGRETDIPIWPFKMFIAAMCFLFCIQMILSMIQGFQKMRR